MITTRKVLIADSGGTKTDWCFIDISGERSFFTTESYHPINWDESFRTRLKQYFEERIELMNAEIYFFGAGCLKREKAMELEKLFHEIGFNKVTVKSDLHAAGLACLGNENGWVAISGTGSVLFEWSNGEVGQIIGGKGHMEGDQGSGYYFGKLIYEDYKSEKLSMYQKQLFETNSSLDEIEIEILKGNSKFIIANIAYQLKKYQKEFESYHLLNIEAFYKYHLTTIPEETINFSGSYVWANENLFRYIFDANSSKIGIVRHHPICHIIDQMVGMID